MHNLGTVVKFEFFRTIKKKSFWISALAIPVVFALILTISYISGKSAEETEQRTNAERFSVAVFDDSGIIKPSVLNNVEARRVTKEVGVAQVREGILDAFIYYPSDPSTQTVEVFGKDVGLAKNGKYANLARQILKLSIAAELNSPQEASILQKDPATKLVAYKNGEQAAGVEQIFAPGAFLVLFYLVIILLGNYMLTSTTEEKENRVMEIILTSVDAGKLIIGKIFAMVLIGTLQVAVISIPVIVSLILFRDKIKLPFNLSDLVIDPSRLLIGAVLFIFSFLLFTGLLVTIGAVVPTAKEAGSFFGIAMFFTFVPLYAVMAIVSDPSQVIVKVFSFFPLTAPITLMLRNAAGNLTTGETILGISILGASSVLVLLIGTRAFRHGTLEYENKLNFRRILKG